MFLANRIYGYKALARIESLLLQYLGPKDGAEALGNLLKITRVLKEQGKLDLFAVFKQFRKSGFTPVAVLSVSFRTPLGTL